MPNVNSAGCPLFGRSLLFRVSVKREFTVVPHIVGGNITESIKFQGPLDIVCAGMVLVMSEQRNGRDLTPN